MTNLPPNLRGAVDLSSLVRPAQQQRPAEQQARPDGGEAPASSVVFAADDASFQAILELSNTVPVVVELHGQGQPPTLTGIVPSYGGRLVLATVDIDHAIQLRQAFQVQQVPTVAAIIAGRPVALFAGEPPEDQVRAVLDQLLQLAAQNGVTGTVPVGDAEAGEETPAEEPLPPHHQEAYDAIAAGDYETAIREYSTAIAQDPRDRLAVAGLAQVKLLQRLEGVDAQTVRSAAAASRTDVEAQLAVADLDLAGGHVDDAFDRLLDVFPALPQGDKDVVRTRLLDYFEIVGVEDPRVVAARRRLTMLLY